MFYTLMNRYEWKVANLNNSLPNKSIDKNKKTSIENI